MQNNDAKNERQNAGYARISTSQTQENAEIRALVNGKKPPQALPLEEAVLGALLLDGSAFSAVSELLTPEAFYTPAHKIIFEAIVRLHEQQNAVDILTVAEDLRKHGELERVGGPVYLTRLTNRIASAANVEYHARIIFQKYVQRKIITVGGAMIRAGYDDATDCFDALQRAEEGLFTIVQSALSRAAVPIGSAVFSAFRQIEQNALKARLENGLTGISSGILTIDQLTGGWQNSDLIVVAARPGIGKTGFALSIALNAANAGVPLAFFSLEMSNAQLIQRMLSMTSGIGGQQIRSGYLSDAQLLQLAAAAGQLEQLPFYLDDTPALTVTELRAKCRRLQRRHGIGLILVDYLQLMQLAPAGMSNRTFNREQEVSGISRALKSLAKELDVPVIALSQLSRAVETRGGAKRPQLSDLRDSGSVEQDSDLVAFIYRPEYYGIRSDEEGNPLIGVAELIFAKNRHGPTETVYLHFEKQITRFSDPSPVFFTPAVANAAHNEETGGFSPAFDGDLPHLSGENADNRPDERIPF